MLINFTKMHGLGNDFIVLDFITQSVRLHPQQLQLIADRHFGIGCDQILCVEPPVRPEADCYYRIYNADGREIEQCLNGARCVAKFLYDHRLTIKKSLLMDCLAGAVTANIEGLQQIELKVSDVATKISKVNLPTSIADNFPGEIYTVNVGNPHAVCLLEKLQKQPLAAYGKKISALEDFQYDFNIGFMQALDNENLKLQVYERGVGMTLACGSGAVAALLVAMHLHLVTSAATIHFPYGQLKLNYELDSKIISVVGPAKSVFFGRFRV